MTPRDIGRAGASAIALLAGALLLLPENAEASQCSRGERVDHRNSECLYAWWKNRGLLKKSPFQVRNQCSEYGKVVAKVDLAWASDRTLHLIDDIPRGGDTRHRIRSISCCSDISDLCNRSDVVTDEGCLARFRQSPASKKCWNASAAISGDDYSCNVSADCEYFDWGMQRLQRHTNITAPWLELDDVNNCSGWLTRGMCEADWVWLSVDDVIAQEAEGATLDFTVTLSQPIPETVTVRYPLPLGLHGTFVPAGGGTRLTTRRLRQESPQDAGSAEGRRSTIQLWLEAFMSPFQVVWPRMHFMARMARENGFGRRPRRRPCRVALLKCHSLHRWSPMAEAPPTATLDGAVPGSTGALCLT